MYGVFVLQTTLQHTIVARVVCAFLAGDCLQLFFGLTAYRRQYRHCKRQTLAVIDMRCDVLHVHICSTHASLGFHMAGSIPRAGKQRCQILADIGMVCIDWKVPNRLYGKILVVDKCTVLRVPPGYLGLGRNRSSRKNHKMYCVPVSIPHSDIDAVLRPFVTSGVLRKFIGTELLASFGQRNLNEVTTTDQGLGNPYFTVHISSTTILALV